MLMFDSVYTFRPSKLYRNKFFFYSRNMTDIPELNKMFIGAGNDEIRVVFLESNQINEKVNGCSINLNFDSQKTDIHPIHTIDANLYDKVNDEVSDNTILINGNPEGYNGGYGALKCCNHAFIALMEEGELTLHFFLNEKEKKEAIYQYWVSGAGLGAFPLSMGKSYVNPIRVDEEDKEDENLGGLSY